MNTMCLDVAYASSHANEKENLEQKDVSKVDNDNILYLHISTGKCVEIELFPQIAPNHVKRIKDLTREHFYDGVPFHRVIENFMVQTGDPTGTGMGGSNKPDLVAEFSSIPHDRGIVSMARASDPDSANSQFFIVLKDSFFLDNQYTVFGKVIKGMEYVDDIKKGDIHNNGVVINPDKIIKMEILSDILKKQESH